VDLKDSTNKALIPLIKEFIVKTDFSKKEIHMKLPPGLIEVNHAL
jgi:ribosomal 30S subunit maturation factor RimM